MNPVAVVTHGRICPCVVPDTTPPAAPEDGEGAQDAAPVTPCGGTGSQPATDPPAAPQLVFAEGPDVPVSPCGTTGSDPTIDPPEVPQGSEGSEVSGDEAPATPRCGKGEET